MKPSSRRHFLRLGATVVATIPFLANSRSASAAKNEAMRQALKYQDHPGPGNKDCDDCMQYVSGKKPSALGGCKLYAGDTEISPKGYCTAWAKKA